MIPSEIESLLQRFIDGHLDEQASEELVCLLKNDPDIFETYCQYAELDSSLSHLGSGMVAASNTNNISTLASGHQNRRTRRITFLTSIAAIVAVILTLSVIWLKTPPALPATFTTGPDTSFTITHPKNSRRVPPSSLEIGSSIHLIRGTLELSLETGVRAILEAPAQLTILDENKLDMSEGIIWCAVPEKASGFKVLTPSLKVTDLGTEFAVETHPGEEDEVHVFKGTVKVTPLNSKTAPLTLTTNEAIALLPDRSFGRIKTKPSSFLTSLPSQPAHFHWRFDESDAGSQSVTGRMLNQKSITSRCTTRDGEELYAAFLVVDGKFGNALSSFGRNGLVKTNWSGIPSDSPFTLSYWIKMTPGQHSPYSLVSWGSKNHNTFPLFSSEVRKTTGGSVTAVTMGTLDLEGTNPIDDGNWHHIALRSTPDKKHPLIECFLDGQPEALQPSEKLSHLLRSNPHFTSKPQPKLSLLDHPRVQALTGEKINLSLIRENGTTSVFLNGKNIGVSKKSPPPFDSLTHLMVGANLDDSGQIEGFFTGSIDHLKLSTFTGSLASRELLGNNHADIKIVADYNFDDHATPVGFQEIGNPTYQGGKLILDGDDALIINRSPLTATDNFIIEVSCTMSGYPTNPRRFSFPLSNGNGRNRGWGIIYHHTWGGIIMGHGPVGSATTDERKISIEMDELHVFSNTLRGREIRNLFQNNQTYRKFEKQITKP
jgi:ferric-dicitrate binding protein FerR (iron transport regulator)